MTDYSIKRFNKYSDEELISALKDVARKLDTKYVPGRAFQKHTGISEGTIEKRFGTWKNFCEKAGLKPVYMRGVDKNDLLKNLDEVWKKLGRQPRAKDMKQPLSPISHSAYLKEFGNWYETCLQFLAWKSGVSAKEIEQESKEPILVDDEATKRKTPRAISLSLRYQVLKRDNFKCVRCGRTPASNPGIELHIDHKLPYSKNGETELDNLQTMCSECNLGKSNRHSE
ncbi:MAG: HNH endonuclease [Candidatus Liptonbacteria bacterium]|nr:HNH endonuclease [Candidatus Liptonbacteria bacterium]